MDVLYLVSRHAPGDHIELRYSLRSLANLTYGRVWIAGHMPGWVRGVGHIPVAQERTSRETGRRVLLDACQADGPTSTVILMHDDYYVMEPVAEVVSRHRGPLADLLTCTRFGWYQDATRRTMELLAERGIADPLCYDATHTPMVIDRAAMAELLAEHGPQLQYKSMYGNVRQVGGVLGNDAKRYRPYDLYASTDTPAGPVWPAVKRRFPDPSPYEEVPVSDAEELAALRAEAAELGLVVSPKANRSVLARKIQSRRGELAEQDVEPAAEAPSELAAPEPAQDEPEQEPAPAAPEPQSTASKRRTWLGPKGRRKTTTRGSGLDRWYASSQDWGEV